jgi:hypothetical protein
MGNKDWQLWPIKHRPCGSAENIFTDPRVSPLAKGNPLNTSNSAEEITQRFAHLKVHHGFERMRIRGFSGARDEFHLAAIVPNLQTLGLGLSGVRSRHGPHWFVSEVSRW